MANSQEASHQRSPAGPAWQPMRDTTPHSDGRVCQLKESRTDWSPGKRVSGVPQAQREGPHGSHRNTDCPETLHTSPPWGTREAFPLNNGSAFMCMRYRPILSLELKLLTYVQVHMVRAKEQGTAIKLLHYQRSLSLPHSALGFLTVVYITNHITTDDAAQGPL